MNLLHPSHQIHHKQLSYGETVRYHPQRTVFSLSAENTCELNRTQVLFFCVFRKLFHTRYQRSFGPVMIDTFTTFTMTYTTDHFTGTVSFIAICHFHSSLSELYLYLRKGHRTSAYLPFAFCRVTLTAHIGTSASSTIWVH